MCKNFSTFKKMRVCIKSNVPNWTELDLDVSQKTNVDDLKTLISEQKGIPKHLIVLRYPSLEKAEGELKEFVLYFSYFITV